MESYDHLKVLIVDDQVTVRKVLRACLERLGVKTIFEATDGDDAFRTLNQNSQINFIFCDLNMPIADGLVLLEKLAAIKSNIPLVLMSGEDEAILVTAEALAERYLLNVVGKSSKPLKITEIERLLSHASRHSKGAPGSTISMSSHELALALDNSYLTPFFQPQIEVDTRRVVGFEALARIEDPQRGLIFPDTFIPLAEKEGLIYELTEKMIEESIKYLSIWRRLGHNLSLAINIAPRVLEAPSFPSLLESIVEKYDVPNSAIVCELTETSLGERQQSMINNMIRLRLKKFRLSLDDFGTGYATMEKLHELPFHELKIDRCFVMDCMTNERSRSFVANNLSLAKELEMVSVAEGVESEAILDYLVTLGCNHAQGFGIARPMPATDVPAYLETSVTHTLEEAVSGTCDSLLS